MVKGFRFRFGVTGLKFGVYGFLWFRGLGLVFGVQGLGFGV